MLTVSPLTIVSYMVEVLLSKFVGPTHRIDNKGNKTKFSLCSWNYSFMNYSVAKCIILLKDTIAIFEDYGIVFNWT